MRSALVIVLLVHVGGCAALDDGAALFDVACDAGLGGAELEALDGGAFDAGFCGASGAESVADADAGVEVSTDTPAIACDPLVVTTCGPANECSEDPGCVAADLLRRFEPERCAAAEADARSFPPCTAGACDRLVDKVCGDAGACLDAPSCTPSQTLQTRSDDGDVSAETSCGTALSDESLFPRCGS